MVKEKRNLSFEEVCHLRNVVSAIISYNNISNLTVADLANSFSVSENVITAWFYEAISNKYVSNEDLCKNVIAKHINEYEKKHNVYSKDLRSMYDSALLSFRRTFEVSKRAIIACCACA